MKRLNFLSWYFNEGIHGIFEIWKNFLVFVLDFFSLKELSLTLFSPWHRDAVAGNWRGWHPLKSLEIFFENMFSRLLGAFVRLCVILLGIFFLLVLMSLGLALVFFWISAPFSTVALHFYLGLNWIAVAAIVLVWLATSLLSFFSSTKPELSEMKPELLAKQPLFKRICDRVETDPKTFSAIFSDEKSLANFLEEKNISGEEFESIVRWETKRWRDKNNAGKFWLSENLKKTTPIGRQWRFGYTVNLDRYCTDLSKGDPTGYFKSELVGRNNEYELLKMIMLRPDQNCVLLAGDSGIGKKTLIHAFALNVRLRNEKSFAEARILLLDLGRVIADAINRGEDVENKLRLIFSESCYAGNVILAIEHVEHFLGKNQSAFHPDISAVLGEFLDIPSFRIIATSTMKEYHELIEKHQEITKYFEVIEMREPSETEAVKILLMELEKHESKRVIFTYKALKLVVKESEKYNWKIPLPERAIDLAMETLMFWEKKSQEHLIKEQTVADYLTMKTGIQHGEIDADEKKKLLNLEKRLHGQVIGQEEAIKQVSEALRRARSGIRNSQKPVGSFMFLGPTGVGKTETAKALAKMYFGDENKLMRFDMSEFQNPSSVDRLLGSSHLNQPGRLATKIKDNPYSIVLLDEIEKAYPDILDLFLQILDEGFVTDAFGEKINFRNTIIIATSNVGAALIKKMVDEGSAAEEIKKAAVDYAIENNIFRTEFLNRFDGVIFFRPLAGNELKSVVRLQLQKLARRVAKEKNIQLEFDENVILDIIDKGYSPIFGARSLNRYIEDKIESVIAKKIISGDLKKGEKISL
ncbi:MAG TPA: ATP-dependent Clp protease ATP-binding subunit [Candidatus Moranbacteria bacterium]|nr:ATP-dependent Clp protease ATP-binding subunit [Candidatus Moranbacteria bacterium]